MVGGAIVVPPGTNGCSTGNIMKSPLCCMTIEQLAVVLVNLR